MKRKIVLASKSPRRKQLLEQIGLWDFEIKESKYEEDMEAMNNPQELAKFLALKNLCFWVKFIRIKILMNLFKVFTKPFSFFAELRPQIFLKGRLINGSKQERFGSTIKYCCNLL